ncbi:hypothetical protein [Amycolatopsis thermoflava]
MQRYQAGGRRRGSAEQLGVARSTVYK